LMRCRLLIGLLLALLLVACSHPKPIPVYVTPTPLPIESPAAGTSGSPGTASSPVASSPTTVAQGPSTPTPTPGSYGSIFTPGDTASPTLTPSATSTPVPSDTVPPIPATSTATPRPTETIGGTPLPPLDANRMGIQIHTNLSQDEYNTMLWHVNNLGLKWIKIQLPWDVMEPTQGSLSDYFYMQRLYVQTAYKAGFKVIVSIVNAPDWARSITDEDGPPTDPQALANFVNQFVTSIDPDPYGIHPIAGVEVWNEPNLHREWSGGALTGADYMRYFDAVYQIIRQDPRLQGITLITAGLAPTGIDDGVNATADRTYLSQMYQAGLNNPAYQNIAIGAHPYGAWNPPDARCCLNSSQGYDNDPSFFFLDTLDDYHSIMLQYGDTGHQIWVTEFGWGTFDGLYDSNQQPATGPDNVPYFAYITDEQMADYIIGAFKIGQDLPYIGPMILWNLNIATLPDQVDQKNPQAAYSVIGTMPDPERPIYTLLVRALKH
jgi:hypothetical protein